MREYDAIAGWYGQTRVDRLGVADTLQLMAGAPWGARVLDLGCGNGRPITSALMEAGYAVVGLDSSALMLAQFRANLPSTPAVRGSALAVPFEDEAFDAAVAWGMLFHLTPDEQRVAIAEIARLLRPRAPWVFTAGDVHSGFEPNIGVMDGVEFRHYSFTRDEYAELLGFHGLVLEDCRVGDGDNVYYLARKRASSA